MMTATKIEVNQIVFLHTFLGTFKINNYLCNILNRITPKDMKRPLLLLTVLLSAMLLSAQSFTLDGLTYQCSDETSATVTGIEYQASNGHVTVPEKVTDPSTGKSYTVTAIGNNAFEWKNLTGITLPETITHIGKEAFSSCSSLKEIVMPQALEVIDEYAFSSCSELEKITIPGNSLKTIARRAFNGCRNITDIYCYVTTPPSIKLTYPSFDSSVFENAVVHVPATLYETYRQSYWWSTFNHITAITEGGGVTLVLHHADGTTTDVELATMPHLQLTDDKMTLTSEGVSQEFSKADIVRFTFKNVVTGINDVTASTRYRMDGDRVTFYNITSTDRISVYNANGMRLPVSLSANGTATILSLSSLGAGVYLVNVNGKTIKFVKP